MARAHRLRHQPGSDLSQYAGVADALRGDSGTIYVTDSGDEQVVAFSAIAPLNWALVIKEPWQTVTDPLFRATEWAPLVLAPVLIIALIGLMFGLRQIVQPLQSLEKKAADRWQSAEELLPQLEALATPSGGVTPTGMIPVDRVAKRRWMLVGGAAALAAAVIAVIGTILLPNRGSSGELDPNRVLVVAFEDRHVQALGQ